MVFSLFDCVFLLYELCVYFENQALSVSLFAHNFSQSIGCLFVYGFLCCAAKLVSVSRSVGVFLRLFLLLWETKKTVVQVISQYVCLCSLLGVLWCHVLNLSQKV